MNNIITVNNLSKAFNQQVALNDISFSIKKGEIFGFLGPSGSGKTTTIRILTKQLLCDLGDITIFDKSIEKIEGTDLSRIGILSDDSGMYEKLTLWENLELYARIFNKSADFVDDLLKEVELFKHKKTKATDLSKGMKQRMLLVRALINEPKILFLDEPTSGLDPNTSQKIHKLLEKLKEKGVSIFLTTHDMKEATDLCDELVFLFEGKIIEKGTPSNIIKKYSDDLNVKITYEGEKSQILNINKLLYLKEDLNNESIISIHSQEPTLEDIFIQLTGVKLNDE
ncbi:ABC transporter ATP-binding protein [Aerococcus urinaeequi]|uniref:ABC transporter ATP-binding protein n=1 Tax=Aerococcus urinaeequi TaxID=51665 RepID=UPI003D6A0B68